MISGGDKFIGPKSSYRYVNAEPRELFYEFLGKDYEVRKADQSTPVINVEGVDEYLHKAEGTGWEAYSRRFRMENGIFRTVQALRITKGRCLATYAIKVFDGKGTKVTERTQLFADEGCD